LAGVKAVMAGIVMTYGMWIAEVVSLVANCYTL